MFKKYYFNSGHSNMTITQPMFIIIVSIDRTHNVLFINEYIINLLCNLKLVKSYLGELR